MTRKLILTTAALIGLTAGGAFAQQNNNSAEDSSPSGPNCASNATAGCPESPEDVNTQSGPGTTGADSQPAPGGDATSGGAPANNQGQPDGDLGGPSTDTGADGAAQ